MSEKTPDSKERNFKGVDIPEDAYDVIEYQPGQSPDDVALQYSVKVRDEIHKTTHYYKNADSDEMLSATIEDRIQLQHSNPPKPGDPTIEEGNDEEESEESGEGYQRIRTSSSRTVRVMPDGKAFMEVYERTGEGAESEMNVRAIPLSNHQEVHNDPAKKFYANKPHLQGWWYWDQGRQDFIQGRRPGISSVQNPPTGLKEHQTENSTNESDSERLKRLESELQVLRDAEKSQEGGIKKRARKKIILGGKKDDSQAAEEDDTGSGIRPGTQERIKNVLLSRKDQYNISDDVLAELSARIDRAGSTDELIAIEDQINKDFGTEYGKKKTGKRKSARTGSGDFDLGEKKGRKVSMEKMPDGRMKFTTTEADGTVTERIEGDEMKFGEGLEETPPEAWEEYGRRYGEQDREEDESTGDMAHYQEELARWNNRSFPHKFWDWLNRKEPPRPRYAPEVLELLARSRSPEERKLIHLVAQATEKHNGIRIQDAADRGEGGRWARIRDSLKGGGKAVALATITAATVAVVMSGGTLAAMPILAKVIGAGVGALASTAAKNRVEKVGRAGKVTKFVVPWLIGTMAGVATGAAAGHAIEAMSSYFSIAVPDAPTPPQGAGQAGANAISPSGRSGVLASSLIPAAPLGFDLGDYGYLGNKVILEPGSNIWSQITSGLCDQGLLDGKGRAAFADAFYRTVEDGGFKDLFLSYNNRPLGSGVFWNNLPVGTVGHYDRLLSNPKFVDMLVDRIGDNYPSLLQKINSGGFSAFDFIRGVAYSHGAKI